MAAIFQKNFEAQPPLGRIGQPEDIAPIAVFLASSDSGWLTGTKDPQASQTLYIDALAAPFTVNTMPEATLKILATQTKVGESLPADGGDCEDVLAQFAGAGIDVDALAAQLQEEGAKSFVKSWNNLMDVIASKSASLTGVR